MEELLKKLTQAFVGESQARNRYTFYAKVAKKEGYEQIASLFQLTADNEKQHAKWFFRMANQVREKLGKEPSLTVEAEAPLVLGSTYDNLKAAIAGEHFEHDKLYPEIAAYAKEKGFPEFEKRILAIAVAEKHHEERYKKLLENVENNSVFKKESKTYWVCRECGYIHEGEEAPDVCPSCNHPQAYFEKKCEEY